MARRSAGQVTVITFRNGSEIHARVRHQCFFCGTEKVTLDNYCYGCTAHICSGCDKNYYLILPHDPEDHKIEPDEEDDW